MAMMQPELPPELLSMLAGGPPPPGAAGQPDMGPPPSGGGGDTVSLIRQMLQTGQQYQQVEQDEEDLAVVAQCMSALQRLLAKNQREADQATGVGPAAKYMRRQSGGGPAY